MMSAMPLAAANTHGDQAIALVQAAQRVCQLGDEDDSGGSHRVAVRHGAAVDVGLFGGKAELVLHGDGLRGEGLVGLDEVDVVQREPGLLQCLRHRSDGADAHAGGIDARDGPADNLGQRLEVARAHLLSGGEDHGRGAVVDAGCVAWGYGSILGKGGLELRKLVDARLPHVLIKVQIAYGDDLLGVDAFRAGGRGAALGLRRELVLALAGDVVVTRDVFRGHAHVAGAEGAGERAGEPVVEFAVAHALAEAGALDGVGGLAHGFGANGKCHGAVARLEELRGGDHGLDAGAAEAVDAHCGRGLGHSDADGDFAGNVQVARDDGHDIRRHRGVDFGGRDTRTLNSCRRRRRTQLG